jgi:hypothetical protein
MTVGYEGATMAGETVTWDYDRPSCYGGDVGVSRVRTDRKDVDRWNSVSK